MKRGNAKRFRYNELCRTIESAKESEAARKRRNIRPPPIVYFYAQLILFAPNHLIGQFETECRKSSFMLSQNLSVQVDGSHHRSRFETDKETFSFPLLRYGKTFGIPAYASIIVCFILSLPVWKRFRIVLRIQSVPCMGNVHPLPVLRNGYLRFRLQRESPTFVQWNFLPLRPGSQRHNQQSQ